MSYLDKCAFCAHIKGAHVLQPRYVTCHHCTDKRLAIHVFISELEASIR